MPLTELLTNSTETTLNSWSLNISKMKRMKGSTTSPKPLLMKVMPLLLLHPEDSRILPHPLITLHLPLLTPTQSPHLPLITLPLLVVIVAHLHPLLLTTLPLLTLTKQTLIPQTMTPHLLLLMQTHFKLTQMRDLTSFSTSTANCIHKNMLKALLILRLPPAFSICFHL